jgi:phage-related protein
MDYTVILLEPAYEFISSLDIKFRAKTYLSIELLKEFGPILREPHSKAIKPHKGLYELRVQLGNNIIRLFYFHHQNTVYVITSGFFKKDNKLDVSEILKAVQLMNGYKEQSNEKN